MAIILCKEKGGARRGDIDDKGVRRYTRVWVVFTDDRLVGAGVVRQAAGIPRVFDPYVTDTELDLGARVKSVEAQEDGEYPLRWEVTVEYSSATGDEEQGQENPLDKPAAIRWSTAKEKKAVSTSVDTIGPGPDFLIEVGGEPITNSASQPFDPPPEVDDTRLVLTITKNQGFFSPNTIEEFTADGGAINRYSFWGFDPGTVHIEDLDAEEVWENGFFFYKVTYVFHIKRSGWKLTLLDCGFCQLSLDLLNWEVIRDDRDGSPISQPALLSAGRKLAADGDPVFMKFGVMPIKDFTVLALP